MEAQHLERYWMFKWVGALPVHRDSAPAAYRDLARAAEVLRRPATGLWVFPQGSRRPAGESIAGTERGAAHLALGAERTVTVWPVGFRYGYRGEQLPEAFVWLGRPATVPVSPVRGRRAFAIELERRLQETVDQLDDRLATEAPDDFRVLVSGRLSINKRLDRVRHALGLLRGPFDDRNG